MGFTSPTARKPCKNNLFTKPFVSIFKNIRFVNISESMYSLARRKTCIAAPYSVVPSGTVPKHYQLRIPKSRHSRSFYPQYVPFLVASKNFPTDAKYNVHSLRISDTRVAFSACIFVMAGWNNNIRETCWINYNDASHNVNLVSHVSGLLSRLEMDYWNTIAFISRFRSSIQNYMTHDGEYAGAYSVMRKYEPSAHTQSEFNNLQSSSELHIFYYIL